MKSNMLSNSAFAEFEFTCQSIMRFQCPEVEDRTVSKHERRDSRYFRKTYPSSNRNDKVQGLQQNAFKPAKRSISVDRWNTWDSPMRFSILNQVIDQKNSDE